MADTKTAIEVARDRVRSLTVGDVLSAYSGREGCRCGCGGKYFYTAANHKVASENRGYPVTDDEVSEHQVKCVLDIIQKNVDDLLSEDFSVCAPGSGVSYVNYSVSRTSVYTVYF